MREIKFRVARYEGGEPVKVYGDVTELDYDEEFEIYNARLKKGKWILNVIPLQFTGIKDKNGVEIYEGDVVEITHPFRQRHHVGEVIYDGYQFNVKGFLFPHYDLPNDAFSEGTMYIEVIGNIYENPELLECEAE